MIVAQNAAVDQDVRVNATDVANADVIQNVGRHQLCAIPAIDTTAALTTTIVTTGEMVTQDHILPVEEEVMAHNTIQNHLPVLVVLSQSLIKTETAS